MSIKIYKACTANVRELKKHEKNLRKMLNYALKYNQNDELNTLTKLYSLLYSAYTETSFLKVINTPYGFDESYIQQIQKGRNIEEKWKKCLDLAFQNIIKTEKGEIANQKLWLNKILSDYIIKPSHVRNKIAHGQWNICLNNECTDVNNNYTKELLNLDYVKIQILFDIYSLFSECVENLIESPYKAHFEYFYQKKYEIIKYIEKTENYTFESKRKKLQSSKKYVSSRKIAPSGFLNQK